MSTTVRACDIDFDTRYAAALAAVRHGEISPEEALLFVVCPGRTEVQFEVEDLEAVPLCRNGLHRMTVANTIVKRDGWKRCRACQSEKAKRRTRTRHSHSKSVPCDTCDNVCWPRYASSPRRCRACWKAQVGRKSLIRGKGSLQA